MKIFKLIFLRKKKKEKEKIIKTLVLPEEVIQHIQSFMSGKEAARSAILSKSWHAAWLTRPTVELDENEFYIIRNRFPNWRYAFREFAKKTIQRYEGFGFKIQSFSLRGLLTRVDNYNLIVRALRLGATHLHLEICWPSHLPQEVLGSETLLRLSLSGCDIYGDYVIRCSRLESLSLEHVTIKSDRFKDVLISCCNSLEELSLTHCHGLKHGRMNLNELRKLRRLYLQGLHLGSMLSTNLVSSFPCLEDLTIHSCTETQDAFGEIDVPNIRKFVYSGDGKFPFVNGASKECEVDITINCTRLYETPWFLNLKRRLARFRLSRISLSINITKPDSRLSSANEGGAEVEAEPIAVENLKIHAHSSLWSGLMLGLLGICRPKLINPEYWHYDKLRDAPLPYMGLMQELIPEGDMFGQFGLERVKMEVYDWHTKEWRPLELDKPLHATRALYNSRKVRFELIWD